jgi:hypothetical protein
MSQIGPLSENNLIELNSVRPITFKSSYHLTGTKTADVTHVMINGVEATSYTDTTWAGDVTLNNITNTTLSHIGDNTITIVGSDNGSPPVSSNQITLRLYRHKMADANGDGNVDTFDLSHLAITFNKDPNSGANYLNDFNEDDFIDTFDFSLLATHWEK